MFLMFLVKEMNGFRNVNVIKDHVFDVVYVPLSLYQCILACFRSFHDQNRCLVRFGVQLGDLGVKMSF